jgi:small-conductance mechanosensitive channel
LARAQRFNPKESGMDAARTWERLRAWIDERVDLEASGEALAQGAVEAAIVALALLLAQLLRTLSAPTTDRWLERLDPRLRPHRVMRALRPLVLPAIWWLLLVVAARVGWMFKLAAPVVGAAATLVALWIAIRATSVLVRDPLLSRLIATVAFLVAALDMFGLLGVVSAALDSLALQLGGLRLSLLTVLKAAIVLALLLWLANAAAALVRLRVARVQALSSSGQVLVANLAKIILVAVAILIALNSVGIDLTALAFFSGAVGLGLGFGLQKVVSNLVSGVILLLDKSIKPGDTIEVESTFGWITSLNARYVSVRSRDGKEFLIPNEDLITRRVTNWSFSSRQVRLDVPFKVAYGSDLHAARRVATAAAAEPSRVLKEPAPVCHVTEFGDDGIGLLLRFWIEDPFNGVTNVKGEVMLRLWERLRDGGFEIPFPQLEIKVKQ